MIIYHQNNIAAFAGNHIWYWPLNPLIQRHIRIAISPTAGVARLLLINPPGLDGGFGTGFSL